METAFLGVARVGVKKACRPGTIVPDRARNWATNSSGTFFVFFFFLCFNLDVALGFFKKKFLAFDLAKFWNFAVSLYVTNTKPQTLPSALSASFRCFSALLCCNAAPAQAEHHTHHGAKTHVNLSRSRYHVLNT